MGVLVMKPMKEKKKRKRMRMEMEMVVMHWVDFYRRHQILQKMIKKRKRKKRKKRRLKKQMIRRMINYLVILMMRKVGIVEVQMMDGLLLINLYKPFHEETL